MASCQNLRKLNEAFQRPDLSENDSKPGLSSQGSRLQKNHRYDRKRKRPGGSNRNPRHQNRENNAPRRPLRNHADDQKRGQARRKITSPTRHGTHERIMGISPRQGLRSQRRIRPGLRTLHEINAATGKWTRRTQRTPETRRWNLTEPS